MIRIMHALYTDNNYVAKDNFPLTMFSRCLRQTIKVFYFLLLSTPPGSPVVHFLP